MGLGLGLGSGLGVEVRVCTLGSDLQGEELAELRPVGWAVEDLHRPASLIHDVGHDKVLQLGTPRGVHHDSHGGQERKRRLVRA